LTGSGRVLILAAALVVLAPTLGVCGGATDRPSSEAATVKSSSTPSQGALVPNNIPAGMKTIFKRTPENLEYAQDTSPVTLSMYYNVVVADPWTWGEDEVTAEIRKLTGVTIEGTYATDKSGNQLTLMLASGAKLPDMITNVGPTSQHFGDMVEGRMILPISKLIDEHCPKMREVLFPIETTYYNDNNGQFWSVSRQQILPNLPNYNTPNGWYAIRTDVYKQLGSPALKSVKDVWSYLAKWKSNKDKWPEIKYPWCDAVLLGTGNISVAYGMLGGITLYSGGGYAAYDDATKSVFYIVDSELGKKALRFYFDLAQAGYITQQSFALKDFTTELKAGSILLLSKPNVWEAVQTPTVDALKANIPGASYDRFPPIHEDGVDFHYYDSTFRPSTSATVITKDCRNPGRAIKFLEFMATEYGNLLATAGIYGKHWQFAPLPNGQLGMVYVGEATDATRRTQLGIYNYNKLWWNLTTNYDFFVSKASAKDDPVRMNNSDILITNSKSIVPSSISFAAGSEEKNRQTMINDMVGTYVTKIILARDQAAFNALYDEMIANLKGNGLKSLCDALRVKCDEYINKLTASGVTWVK
jgi:putative aldouronate transport system substrate-binding protein